MTCRSLFSLLLVGAALGSARPGLAQDPAPAEVPVEAPALAAPVPPAGAVGLLIANRTSGIAPLTDKRQFQALFRGTLQTAPNGERVLIYVLPVHDLALEDVLQKTLSWSEVVFERQIPTTEATLGRIYFKRLPSSAEVLKAVSSDPGGVGVVSADTPLNPNVIILWPPVAP